MDFLSLISGAAIAPGTSTFRVRVTDAAGQTATADLAIAVVQALAVHTSTLRAGVVGEAYAEQLQAVGGRGTLMWSVAGAETVPWLAVSPAGALSGTPVASGAFTVTVAVADESGQQATRQFPIAVLDPVAVAPISLPTATEGRVYAVHLVATGGDGMYTWDVASGALPTGVALGSVGALLGTPEQAGVFTFTARVTDAADRVGTRSLTLTVERAPTIQTASLPPGEPGEPYAVQLVATGGTGDVDLYVRQGALPREFVYDCRPLRQGNEEICTFTPPAVGPWYIMLRGYIAYTGVSLVASYEE